MARVEQRYRTGLFIEGGLAIPLLPPLVLRDATMPLIEATGSDLVRIPPNPSEDIEIPL